MTKVTIVIQGLIALTPLFGPQGEETQYLAALVADSKDGPTRHECIEKHQPMIHFTTTEKECTADFFGLCDTTENENECVCPLKRQDVFLLPDENPEIVLENPRQEPSSLPPSPLPENSVAAGRFSYVANLSHLEYRLDPRFLKSSPPEELAARFRFPFDDPLLACDHSLREDSMGRADVHVLDFRAEGGGSDPTATLRQAGAQTLVASVNYGSSDLVLVLKDFDDGSQTSFRLKGEEILIQLKNHRQEALPLNHRCNDGVGRDFGLFYGFVEEPPPWELRKIPHIDPDDSKPRSEIQPVDCRSVFTPNSRPICPLATIP